MELRSQLRPAQPGVDSWEELAGSHCLALHELSLSVLRGWASQQPPSVCLGLFFLPFLASFRASLNSPSLSVLPGQHWTPQRLAGSSPTRLDKQPSPSWEPQEEAVFSLLQPRMPSPLIWAAFPGSWLGTYVNSSLVHLKEKRLPGVWFLAGKLCLQNKLLPRVCCQFTDKYGCLCQTW